MSEDQFRVYCEIIADPEVRRWNSDLDACMAFGNRVSVNNNAWAIFQAMLQALNPEISEAQDALLNRIFGAFKAAGVEIPQKLRDAVSEADDKRTMSRVIDRLNRHARLNDVYVPTWQEAEDGVTGGDKPFDEGTGRGDSYS